jgi:hypothetical protein
MVLDSQQADRINVNPPAQRKDHVGQEGMGIGGAHHDLQRYLPCSRRRKVGNFQAASTLFSRVYDIIIMVINAEAEGADRE